VHLRLRVVELEGVHDRHPDGQDGSARIRPLDAKLVEDGVDEEEDALNADRHSRGVRACPKIRLTFESEGAAAGAVAVKEGRDEAVKAPGERQILRPGVWTAEAWVFGSRCGGLDGPRRRGLRRDDPGGRGQTCAGRRREESQGGETQHHGGHSDTVPTTFMFACTAQAH
jgi:hypothetical protein